MTSKSERLSDLLLFLESQMMAPPEERESILLEYLNRVGPTSSVTSLKRWKAGEQFPWRSKRILLAQAIGCTHPELDRFLLKEEPENPKEFFARLPELLPEYRSRKAELKISVSSELQILEGMKVLNHQLVQMNQRSPFSLSRKLLGILENLIGLLDIESMVLLKANLSKTIEFKLKQLNLNSQQESRPGQIFSAIFANKNLGQLSEDTQIPLARLEAIAKLQVKPSDQELSLLEGFLEVSLEELIRIRATTQYQTKDVNGGVK
ncbi:hypothetical protein [Laspinema olomoucense]|uniref:hypothetical protein n=1 Tax=Laspinema olomoucense TaxID=3231600 RepID=UPI0021BB1A15|nr:hypothetical protein [Laspinema sp. D3d]MCT7973653.1 hypothetical protein [Laspinema sp. D3d]